jgi:uroporphyrinogen decarboxylase
MTNKGFHNALRGIEQAVPPIWLMRQAGRYHGHYQALREQHSFMELCKNPILAAEVAMGPIVDFDFDVAILFSDLLFPLEALGMELDYAPGPVLRQTLTKENVKQLKDPYEALFALEFQKTALQMTRQKLPENKSLIGFVGGPWTLFTYAVEGAHKGNLIASKSQPHLFHSFCERLIPLLQNNIRLQLEGGAEMVMIFDTAAGELSPACFHEWVVPKLKLLVEQYPCQLGYYAKGIQAAHLAHPLFQSGLLAGIGFHEGWDLKEQFGRYGQGFYQGNFDQSLFFLPRDQFQDRFERYLQQMKSLGAPGRKGWICGLGHGVLPQTPTEHVRYFVKRTREVLFE